MLGRAKATMPSRQADLDLNKKSACRKNQNKRAAAIILDGPCLAFAIPGAISIIAKAIHRSSALSQRTGMNCALAGAPAAIFKPAR